MQKTVNNIVFDAAARTPFYQEVLAQNNSVDPVTGINVGAPDTTTPLDIVFSQGGAVGMGGTPAAIITQIGVIPDGQSNAGARVLRIAPGVLAPGGNAQPWSATVSVHGAPSGSDTTVLSGSTPPPPNVQGVLPVGALLTIAP